MDWVMLGPLTGAHAGLDSIHEAMRETAETIREQCLAAGVPIYMKPECAEAWPGIRMVQEMPEALASPPCPPLPSGEAGERHLTPRPPSPRGKGENGDGNGGDGGDG